MKTFFGFPLLAWLAWMGWSEHTVDGTQVWLHLSGVVVYNQALAGVSG